MSVPRVPDVGDDVLFHFEFRGGMRKRPAKITSLARDANGNVFANLVVWFDAMLDGRQYHDRTGFETNVRALKPDQDPEPHSWSFK